MQVQKTVAAVRSKNEAEILNFLARKRECVNHLFVFDCNARKNTATI